MRSVAVRMTPSRTPRSAAFGFVGGGDNRRCRRRTTRAPVAAIRPRRWRRARPRRFRPAPPPRAVDLGDVEDARPPGDGRDGAPSGADDGCSTVGKSTHRGSWRDALVPPLPERAPKRRLEVPAVGAGVVSTLTPRYSFRRRRWRDPRPARGGGRCAAFQHTIRSVMSL